jgi:hypothetical protein
MITPRQYRKAAALVRQRGKATGCFIDAENRVCAAGALQHLYLTTEDEKEALRQVAAMLGWVTYGTSGLTALGTITAWNDRPDTTTEDVAQLLEQAAEKLEAESGVTV